MSSTLTGAIKAKIATGVSSLQGRVFRDRAPEKTKFPYATIVPDISDTNAMMGDAAPIAKARNIQADLWEIEEDDVLWVAMKLALDGAQLLDTEGKVWRCRVRNVSRSYEPDTKIIHRAFDLVVIYAA